MRMIAVALAVACSSHGPKPFVDLDSSTDRWTGIGIPVVGNIAFKATLTSPKNEYATATGTASVRCGHCTLGDGGKLGTGDPSVEAFSAGGIDFGTIDVGKIDGTATFENGKGTVDISAGTPSTVEITLKGTVVLANELAKSEADLHLAFRISDALRTADPKSYAVLSTTGANADDKGWFKIHLTGPLDHTRRIAE